MELINLMKKEIVFTQKISKMMGLPEPASSSEMIKNMVWNLEMEKMNK